MIFSAEFAQDAATPQLSCVNAAFKEFKAVRFSDPRHNN